VQRSVGLARHIGHHGDSQLRCCGTNENAQQGVPPGAESDVRETIHVLTQVSTKSGLLDRITQRVDPDEHFACALVGHRLNGALAIIPEVVLEALGQQKTRRAVPSGRKSPTLAFCTSFEISSQQKLGF